MLRTPCRIDVDAGDAAKDDSMRHDEQGQAPSAFTYDQHERSTGPEALLNLLLEYRDVESALRRRVAEQLQVGDTEVLALRYLARAATLGESLRPSDIRDLIGLTTGATTALIDRLETRGLVRRERHPSDRRSVLVSLDSLSTPSVRAALEQMQANVLAVAQELDPQELATIERFLHRLVAVTRDLTDGPPQPV